MICYVVNTTKRIVKLILNTAFVCLAVAGLVYIIERNLPAESQAEAVEVVETELTPEQLADRAALLNGINPALVRAVMHVESNQNPIAVSPKRARGLMQIMPANYERCGLEHPGKLYEPDLNVACGAQILAEELNNYTLPDALRVYNGGPRALKRQFRESENYVKKVTAQLLVELDKEVRS